jgi:hypothetical protein
MDISCLSQILPQILLKFDMKAFTNSRFIIPVLSILMRLKERR